MRVWGLGLVVVVGGLAALLLGADLGTRTTVVVGGLAAGVVFVGAPAALYVARGNPERGIRLLEKLEKALSKL